MTDTSKLMNAAYWQAYFDWIPVVNLQRRPERWAAFMDRYRGVQDWPFRAPDRFDAVDGALFGAPAWFKAGAPAWGCAQSHLHILETAIQKRYNRILVLEDDAVFCPDFANAAKQYLAALPADWHQAYFGGQHLHQKVQVPKLVNPHVMQAFNINRTHGYALNSPFFKPLYHWLVDYVAWAKMPAYHIDHHMGRLHETRRYNIYTPPEFIVGQSEGHSDITCKDHPMRFWSLDKPAARLQPHAQSEKPPFVAVIGVHRSGSSMLAWILKHLGVHMGNKVSGNCEAVGLAQLCERLYPFGRTTPACRLDVTANELNKFVLERTNEAARMKILAGGKYPHLCAMRDLLLGACKWGLKIIHIDRPIEDSVASLVTRVRADRERGVKWLGISDDAATKVQHWLHKEKQKYFDGKIPASNILHVNYYDVLKNPQAEIDRIVAFLGLKPTPIQMAAALGSVQPKRRKHLNGVYVGPGGTGDLNGVPPVTVAN